MSARIERLDRAIRAVIRDNPCKAQQVRERPSEIGWLVGRVMMTCAGFTYATVESRLKSAIGEAS